MTAPSQNGQSPVFVLSAERSGSTLLRYLLDSHQDVGSPGELLLGSLCYWLVNSLPRLRPDSGENLQGQVQTEVRADARRIVDEMMNAFLARTGKRVWCDKSPANLKYLPSLTEVFPDARFICLYRSCLDTVNSCLEASRFGFMWELQEYAAKSPSNLVQAMMESWVEKNTRLLMFETNSSKTCVRVRYEDIVRNPEREMIRVCQFLNLSWNPEMVTKALSIPHSQGGGDKKIRGETEIHQRSLGGGSQLPLVSIPAMLIGRANYLLKSLGYEAI